jgi:ABC-2 type transport system permease protein
MARYVMLYLHFMRFSISRAFEFRVDFFFRVIMDLAYYGVNLGFYKIVFLQTPMLGGWNQDQIFVFTACYLVVDAIGMTVFSNNLWWIPVLVNRGDLDYYLLRPVSSLFFLTLRDFAANSCLNLLFALGILGWAVARLPGPMHPGAIAGLVALLGCGALLHSMVHLLLVLPVFWMHSGSGLHTIFYSTARFMERPDRIYTGWVRKILLTVMPYCIMASFPARIFLEGLQWSLLLHFAAVLVTFSAIILFIWQAGLRSYSSASS